MVAHRLLELEKTLLVTWFKTFIFQLKNQIVLDIISLDCVIQEIKNCQTIKAKSSNN